MFSSGKELPTFYPLPDNLAMPRRPFPSSLPLLLPAGPEHPLQSLTHQICSEPAVQSLPPALVFPDAEGRGYSFKKYNKI